jgi:hypothetical protein
MPRKVSVDFRCDCPDIPKINYLKMFRFSIIYCIFADIIINNRHNYETGIVSSNVTEQ